MLPAPPGYLFIDNETFTTTPYSRERFESFIPTLLSRIGETNEQGKPIFLMMMTIELSSGGYIEKFIPLVDGLYDKFETFFNDFAQASEHITPVKEVNSSSGSDLLVNALYEATRSLSFLKNVTFTIDLSDIGRKRSRPTYAPETPLLIMDSEPDTPEPPSFVSDSDQDSPLPPFLIDDPSDDSPPPEDTRDEDWVPRKRRNISRKGKAFPVAVRKENDSPSIRIVNELNRCQVPIIDDNGELINENFLSDNCFISSMREQLLEVHAPAAIVADFDKFSAVHNICKPINARLITKTLDSAQYPSFKSLVIAIRLKSLNEEAGEKDRTIIYKAKKSNGEITTVHLELIRLYTGQKLVEHFIPMVNLNTFQLLPLCEKGIIASLRVNTVGGVLRGLWKNNLLVKLTGENAAIFNSSFRKKLNSNNTIDPCKVAEILTNPLSLSPARTAKKEKDISMEKTDKGKLRIFCDFEAVVGDGAEHRPFCLCAYWAAPALAREITSNQDKLSSLEDIKRTLSSHLINKKLFICGDSTKDDLGVWLYTLKNTYKVKKIILYFHNLRYDYNMFLRYITVIRRPICKGATRMLRFTGILCSPRYYVSVTIKDTAGVLACRLEEIPTFFWSNEHAEAVKEEYGKIPFPYRLLHEDKPVVKLMDVLEEIEVKGPASPATLTKIAEFCVIGENEEILVKLHEYCVFYCFKDCELLFLGWNKYRTMFGIAGLAGNKIDIDRSLTLPGMMYSLAKGSFFNNPQVIPFGASLRLYEQLGLRGGRCMTANNMSYIVRGKKIKDFDAVALYPSAMNRLYCFEGRPEHLKTWRHYKENMSLVELGTYICGEEEESNGDTLTGGTFTIKITSLKKRLAFPLLCYKDKKKGCKWTNIPQPDTILVVNEIELQNLLVFQKIDGFVLDGIIWQGKKDFSCRKVIVELTDARKLLKEQNNPLERSIKLLTNSCYGKSVMKPVDEEVRFVADKDLESHISNSRHKISEFWPIKHTPFYGVKQLCEPEAPEFFFNWWGSRVLSMSKRIMSEVMVLAEDLKIPIYYTDTDSIHIDDVGLPCLEQEFRQKYGRDLIGKQLGQFHSDFFKDEEAYADLSIFVDKKIYYDRVILASGDVMEHFRLKGVPQEGITAKADESFSGNLKDLYEHLLKHPITFPVSTIERPTFLFKREGIILSSNNMQRTIKNSQVLIDYIG